MRAARRRVARFFVSGVPAGLDRADCVAKKACMIDDAKTASEPVRLTDTPGALAGLLETAQRAAFSGPQKLNFEDFGTPRNKIPNRCKQLKALSYGKQTPSVVLLLFVDTSLGL